MRLLLCEDERSLSKAIVTILEKSNYSVDAVYDGEEALEYASTGNYDGIILDLMMPKLDGMSVLKAIRENLKLTQQQIADKCNIYQSTYNHYETGYSLIKISFI